MSILIQNVEDNFLCSCNLNYSIKNYRKITDNYISNGEKFIACILDIEKFRYYNYFYGYEHGNFILLGFSNLLYKYLNMRGHVLRFGGDRLLVIMPVNKTDNGTENIMTLIDMINSHLFINEKSIIVNFKAGISTFPDDSNKPDMILNYAEIALNYAKRITKVRYEFFKPFMYEDIEQKGVIFHELDYALRENQFSLHYQPLIHIDSMTVYGMEALLRWNSPKFGMLYPDQFIDILEQSRMINKVGKFIFKEACSSIKQWHKLGYRNLSLSINVSEIQLEDINFLDYIDKILENTQVNPNLINIEITETILMSTVEKILNILNKLRSKGIKIFIDDFGTEYSSLNYLYKLPIDGIKIDKSFIDRIDSSNKELIILKNIINMAREIEIDLIAEGVEKKEQLDNLLKIKCPKAQGYLLGKPFDFDECIKYLERNYKI